MLSHDENCRPKLTKSMFHNPVTSFLGRGRMHGWGVHTVCRKGLVLVMSGSMKIQVISKAAAQCWVGFISTAPASTAPLCPAVKFKILLSAQGNFGADHCKVRKTKFLAPD